MAYSNINQNLVQSTGNTGLCQYGFDHTVINGAYLVPKGTLIPANSLVSQSSIATVINAGLINQTPSLRWYGFTPLDNFKLNTKEPSSEDSGLLQTVVTAFQPSFNFDWKTNFNTWQNVFKAFQNCQGFYDIFFVDNSGNLIGTADPAGSGGLLSIALYQWFMYDHKPMDSKDPNIFTIRITLQDRNQFNNYFAAVQAGIVMRTQQMVQSVYLTDAVAGVYSGLALVSGQIAVTGTFSNGAADLAFWYGVNASSPLTATNNWIVTDLNTGSAVTISAIAVKSIVSGGITYNVFVLTCSGTTAGHVYQVKLGTITNLTTTNSSAYFVTDQTSEMATHTMS